MMSHIQNKKNKIFLENSPERKNHDKMLIKSPVSKKSSFISHAFPDEANFLEKVKST